MAYSIRAKSKRKFRAIKRAQVFQPVADVRLQRCTARLHKDSKVCHVEEPAPDPPTYSFSFKEALIDAPNAARRMNLEVASSTDDAVNSTYGVEDATMMDIADHQSDGLERKRSVLSKVHKKKGKSYNKNTGAFFKKIGKDGVKRTILKW